MTSPATRLTAGWVSRMPGTFPGSSITTKICYYFNMACFKYTKLVKFVNSGTLYSSWFLNPNELAHKKDIEIFLLVQPGE